MSSASAFSCRNCHDRLERCRRLLTQLSSGLLDWEEFAYNFSLGIVQTCERCMQEAVDSIPPALVTNYLDYLQVFLVPVDFMPCPRPFIAGYATPSAIEKTSNELRPRYSDLYRIATTAATKARQSGSSGLGAG